nr:MAG TPA: hypothetical protein [Caudoviricetes sp.]
MRSYLERPTSIGVEEWLECSSRLLRSLLRLLRLSLLGLSLRSLLLRHLRSNWSLNGRTDNLASLRQTCLATRLVEVCDDARHALGWRPARLPAHLTSLIVLDLAAPEHKRVDWDSVLRRYAHSVDFSRTNVRLAARSRSLSSHDAWYDLSIVRKSLGGILEDRRSILNLPKLICAVRLSVSIDTGEVFDHSLVRRLEDGHSTAFAPRIVCVDKIELDVLGFHILCTYVSCEHVDVFDLHSHDFVCLAGQRPRCPSCCGCRRNRTYALSLSSDRVP